MTAADSPALFSASMPEPVFAEPWEARAFALTVYLHAHGHFTWSEWSAEFAQALAARHNCSKPYYEVWVAALESLLAAKRIIQPDAWAADLHERQA